MTELIKLLTAESVRLVSKVVLSGRATTWMVPELPSRTTAAFMVFAVGRWNQLESPLELRPCQAEMALVLPEFKTSKTSNSPHPDFQHEQSPYWMVRGTSALSIHAAGMSALKPVFPDIGIENSTRKSLDAPLKPSSTTLLAPRSVWLKRLTYDKRLSHP